MESVLRAPVVNDSVEELEAERPLVHNPSRDIVTASGSVKRL